MSIIIVLFVYISVFDKLVSFSEEMENEKLDLESFHLKSATHYLTLKSY